MKKEPLIRKIFRISLWLLLSLVIFVGALLLLLQLPPVQTFIAQKVVNVISEKTGVAISIDKVAIRFLDNVQLENIFIEDLEKDTLLFAGKLRVDINLFKLLKQKVLVEQISLQDAVFNLKQNTTDSAFNFQFLLDAYVSDAPPKEKEEQPTEWQIGIGRVDIQNVRSNIALEPSGFYLQGAIGKFSATTKIFDLEAQQITFDKILLHHAGIAMQIEPREPKKDDADTIASPYIIPDVGWIFSANKIDFENNSFSLDNNAVAAKEKGFDHARLHLTDLSLLAEQVFFGNNIVSGSFKKGAVADQSGLQLKELKGEILIDTAGFDFKNLLVATQNSLLNADILLQFPSLQSLATLDENVMLQAAFKKSHVAASEVAFFIPGVADELLNDLGTVTLDGNIHGTPADLTGDKFVFAVDENNRAALNFHAKGLPDIDAAYFVLNMEEIVFTADFITKISGAELPDEVKRLGGIAVSGQYRGTIRDMLFDGTVSTKLGNLAANLQAKFNDDYSNAEYDGSLQLKNFQLGTLLNDTTIGKVSLEANVTGKGLLLEEIQADIRATILEAGYRNYTYNDLKIEGTVDGKKFTGQAKMNDENLKFDFNGLVNLADTVPVFRFEMALDTVNLAELNLFAQPLGISAKIEVDFKGADLAQFEGHATLSDIHLSNDSLHVHLDSVKALAQVSQAGGATVELFAPFIEAKLSGNYNFAELPRLLVNYVSEYFPLEKEGAISLLPAAVAGMAGDKRKVADQQFELFIAISQPLEVLQMFVPEIEKLDTANITFAFDSRQQLLDLNVFVPEFKYANISTDSILFQIKGGADTLALSLTLDTINYDDKVKIPFAFHTLFYDSQIALGLKIDGDTVSRLEMNGNITHIENELLRFAFTEKMLLNNEVWNIAADNAIDFRPDYFTIQNVSFQQDEHIFKIHSRSTEKNAPVDITFNNFYLQEFSDLLDVEELSFTGVMNGMLTYDHSFEHLALTADLKVEDINVNEHPVGILELHAGWQGTVIDARLQISGQDNELLMTGNLKPETGMLSLNLDMQRLNIAVADPFMREFIRNSSGYLSAKIDITGKMLSPDVKGHLAFHDVSTHVVPANSRFTLPDKNRIEIQPDKFTLKNFELLDAEKGKATLNGTITHRYFTKYDMDLSLNTNGFLFMNTTEDDNEFLYGKIIMALNARVRGAPELPNVSGSASAKEGTRVFIQPLTGEEALRQHDYIIFQSPPFERGDDTLAIQDYKVNISGVILNLLFELTPQAEIQIIIDPLTGDRLTVKGEANLVVDVSPAGGAQITGTYTVESGNYTFSYQGMMRRQFDVQKGSRIIFSGDPLLAALDITASHTVEATTYELIAAQSASLSESDITASKRRMPVSVLLKIGGRILEPEISFDIRLPAQTNPVTGIAARQLAQIRENPTELNKQVFGLLLFRSFIAEDGSNPDLAAAGQNVALKSVSRLLTNQMNALADRAKGFEINFDLDAYKSKYELDDGSDLVTQVHLDVSKKLLNERLQFTVGGNVHLEAGDDRGALSNVLGDFTVEYKLTESGRYRVKVFQTGSYDVLNQASLYRTGAGLIYRHSFRKLLRKGEKMKEPEEVEEGEE